MSSSILFGKFPKIQEIFIQTINSKKGEVEKVKGDKIGR